MPLKRGAKNRSATRPYLEEKQKINDKNRRCTTEVRPTGSK